MKSRAICKIELSLIALVKLAVKKATKTVFRLIGLKSKNNKILVLAVSHIGDTICCIPALSLLREQYPNHKIDFFCIMMICSFVFCQMHYTILFCKMDRLSIKSYVQKVIQKDSGKISRIISEKDSG